MSSQPSKNAASIAAAHQWVVAYGTIDLTHRDRSTFCPDPSAQDIADWKAHVATCGISDRVTHWGYPSVDIEHHDSNSGCHGITGIVIGEFEQCRCDDRMGYIVNVSAESVTSMFEDFVWAGNR